MKFTHTHTRTHTCTHTHTHTHTLSLSLSLSLPPSFTPSLFSGVIGSGLCLFSRYPIIAVFSHEFNTSGGVWGFSDGEVFGGKGIIGCRIQTPLGTLAVFNTHVRESSPLAQCLRDRKCLSLVTVSFT